MEQNGQYRSSSWSTVDPVLIVLLVASQVLYDLRREHSYMAKLAEVALAHEQCSRDGTDANGHQEEIWSVLVATHLHPQHAFRGGHQRDEVWSPRNTLVPPSNLGDGITAPHPILLLLLYTKEANRQINCNFLNCSAHLLRAQGGWGGWSA